MKTLIALLLMAFLDSCRPASTNVNSINVNSTNTITVSHNGKTTTIVSTARTTNINLVNDTLIINR